MVYKVRNLSNNIIFAMKVISKANTTQVDDMNQLKKEIHVMSILRHEFITSLYEIFDDINCFYLISDYCPGGDLMSYISQNVKIDEEKAAEMFSQIAKGIKFCHSQGIAHRNLNLESILLDKDDHIRISNFGLSGFIGERKLMDSFCTSPCYAAPECLYHKPYDGRKSDIWSLGVILFIMITGNYPWHVTNINQMMKEIVDCKFQIPDFVSSKCKDLIENILVVNPDDLLSIDSILNHPFLVKYSNSKISDYQSTRKQSLPPLVPTSVVKPPASGRKRSGSLTGQQGQHQRSVVVGIPMNKNGNIPPGAIQYRRHRVSADSVLSSH